MTERTETEVHSQESNKDIGNAIDSLTKKQDFLHESQKINRSYCPDEIYDDSDNLSNEYDILLDNEEKGSFPSYISEKGISITEEDQQPFKDTLSKMDFCSFLCETWYYLAVGIPLSINTLTFFLVISFSYFYIGGSDDPVVELNFGIGVCYYNIVIYSIIYGCYESTGANLAKLHGATAYRRMNAVFIQGFLLLAICLVFSICALFFSEQILQLFGIKAENVRQAAYMLKFLIPTLVIHGINRQLMAFCMAQHIIKPFGYSNIVGCLICICVIMLCNDNLKIGILVFPVCTYIIEGVNLMVTIYIWLFWVKEETFVSFAFKEFIEGLGKFIWEGLNYITCYLIEVVVIGICVIMACMSNEEIQVSAQICFFNVVVILYGFGLAFGAIIRTKVGNLLGQFKYDQAVNATQFYLQLNIVIGFVISGVIVLFRNRISKIYSANLFVNESMSYYIMIGMFYMIQQFAKASNTILMRVTNNVQALLWINVTNLAVLTFWLFCKNCLFDLELRMGIEGIVVQAITTDFFCNILYVLFAFRKTKL